ncbi:MAG: twin-arginine translocase TatA/TatE family subunit [Clostridia bacterium]|nr:MAG: twin-arginine translocase TatA/TatE family subunit [Clostridia bacterium]
MWPGVQRQHREQPVPRLCRQRGRAVCGVGAYGSPGLSYSGRGQWHPNVGSRGGRRVIGWPVWTRRAVSCVARAVRISTRGVKLVPFHIGLPELVIILVIALIVFGAGKLPGVGRALGRSIREFKEASGGKIDAIATSEGKDEVNLAEGQKLAAR